MNRPINFESLVINQLEIQTRFHLNIIYLIDIYFYFQLGVFKTIMVITIPACTLLPDIYIYIYISKRSYSLFPKRWARRRVEGISRPLVVYHGFKPSLRPGKVSTRYKHSELSAEPNYGGRASVTRKAGFFQRVLWWSQLIESEFLVPTIPLSREILSTGNTLMSSVVTTILTTVKSWFIRAPLPAIRVSRV